MIDDDDPFRPYDPDAKTPVDLVAQKPPLERQPGPRPAHRPATAEPWGDVEPRVGDGVSGTSPGVKLERLDKELKQRRRRRPWYAALLAGAATSLSTAAVAAFVHSLRAQDTADATNGRLDERLRLEEHERTKLDAKVDTVKTQADRMDSKLDLLLDAARVPAAKRPEKGQ